MAYRLGLDIGTNSIGWSCVNLGKGGEPDDLIDMGVRIFPDGRDPQSGASLATDRRNARSARRNRDRHLLRKADLMSALVEAGLMPEDKAERKALETLDPYDLRKKGLDLPLTLHELGRAIFHLHQRRGFKSNRKTDKGADEDSGLIRKAVEGIEHEMAESGARTIGEYLAMRHERREGVRARLVGVKKSDKRYVLYAERRMVEDEFDALWAAQAQHHPALNEERREKLREIVFRQRPLKPVTPGKCALDPATGPDDAGGFRAPWALPMTQRFRVIKEVNNLQLVLPDRSRRLLSLEERNKIIAALFASKKRPFDQLRKLLSLDPDVLFNLESERRKHLDGDQTAAVLAGKKMMGKGWHGLSADMQNAVVEKLLGEENRAALVDWLQATLSIDSDAAERMADVKLPEGVCRYGRRALSAILPIMEDQGLDEFNASKEAGYSPFEIEADGGRAKLPYYGEALPDAVIGTGNPSDRQELRVGRIPNPTVHVGMNQLRRVVNAIIDRYGKPDEIIVELARELKQSQKDRDRHNKLIKANQDKNDDRREKLAALGLSDNGENMMRLRLWEELNPSDPAARNCVYTGRQISMDKLFSAEVEIEHILPFSRTLDNSAANRTVSYRYANREKRNKTPYEAFSTLEHSGEYRGGWAGILERSGETPANKRWRFGPDAMERFEKESDFLDRQLTDTAYLAKLAKQYLGQVCPPNRVWVTPGRLTGMLRGLWGLNNPLGTNDFKDRSDHRHHAIDAFVIAMTGRGMLNKVSRKAARSEERDAERLLADIDEPFPDYRAKVIAGLQGMTVSHRTDHGIDYKKKKKQDIAGLRGMTVSRRTDPGTTGKLHEATAYGPVADPARELDCNLVARKPLADLTAKEVRHIRDESLRGEVTAWVEARDAFGDKKMLAEALAAFTEERGVRRVRVLKKEKDMIWLRDEGGKAYKAYSPGDNHCVELFELPDGAIKGEGITVFQANQPGFAPRWREDHPDARLFMRAHKGDLLSLEIDDRREVMKIQRLEPSSNRVRAVPHFAAGDFQKRHDDKEDPFRWLLLSFGKLKEYKAKPVRVDELGRVFALPVEGWTSGGGS